LAYEKPQSGLRPFVRFFSGTFFCALETYGVLYRAQKNVAYNRNVMRHFLAQVYRRRRPPWRLKFVENYGVKDLTK
jgi:hypothetical protein